MFLCQSTPEVRVGKDPLRLARRSNAMSRQAAVAAVRGPGSAGFGRLGCAGRFPAFFSLREGLWWITRGFTNHCDTFGNLPRCWVSLWGSALIITEVDSISHSPAGKRIGTQWEWEATKGRYGPWVLHTKPQDPSAKNHPKLFVYPAATIDRPGPTSRLATKKQ